MSIQIESDPPKRLLERWLQSEQELNGFLVKFLGCRLPVQEWTHRAHLSVAALLVEEHGRTEALRTLRTAISNYNESTGGTNSETAGYLETLTVFWIDRVAALMERLPGEWERLDRVRAVVEAYGLVRRLDLAYYTFDAAASREARREWIPPDR
ncbi:MAG: hypothetical protein U5J83_11395 [Bryobacterales bacterium]|nr:hypothetical protein [Bryobacterales bacterium]